MRYSNTFSLLVAAVATATDHQSSAFVVPSLSGSGSSAFLKSLSPSAAAAAAAAEGAGQQISFSPLVDDFLQTAPMIRRVQGDTLKTWDFPNPDTSRVQVGARGSAGRPVTSRIEYWHVSVLCFQITVAVTDIVLTYVQNFPPFV